MRRLLIPAALTESLIAGWWLVTGRPLSFIAGFLVGLGVTFAFLQWLRRP